MARRQSPAQKKTVERVMHEFKHGELESGRSGRKVRNPKQAIAIALHEAGASKYESEKTNRENLRHTKEKERKGLTARDQKEGRGAKRSGQTSRSGTGSTKRRSTTAKSGRSTTAKSRRSTTAKSRTARRSSAAKSRAARG